MKRTALSRSTQLKPGQPLKSAAFKRAERKEAATYPKFKRSRPRSTKIRASAQNEDCTLRFPRICNNKTDTTVLCHSNLLVDGKGLGLKAPDTEAAYGCSKCHDVLDGRAPRPAGMTYETMIELFRRGVERTHERLRAKGLLKAKE